MGLRPRRNVVVWSSSRLPGGRYGPIRSLRPARTRRVRRIARTGWLLTLMGLLWLARGVRWRWRPLLAGGALTAVGLLVRGGAGSIAFLPGILFLYAALLSWGHDPDRGRRLHLERELAGYSTPAQRRDLEATFDRYPDSATGELRAILASVAADAARGGIPGANGGAPSPFTLPR